MKFVLASYGTRGDVEPCAAVGLELLRRGHDVCIAVPPNMLGFAESAGLAAVAYGPDSQALHDVSNFSMSRDPLELLRTGMTYVSEIWAQMGMTLTELANEADLLLTAVTQEGLAANVAEYYDIPVAALHYFPRRVLANSEWLDWLMNRDAENGQRRALGLPEATEPSMLRMAERGSLEIQAYEEFFFPELAAEWAEQGSRRPFVGALTLELPTDADGDVLSWIGAGRPPIYFGFGSMQVASPADTVVMIGEACAQLGERALICSGPNDFSQTPHFDHVKVVGAVNHAAIFPACRAVVHHGGPGTTAAGMRAGMPALVLCIGWEQPIWQAVVERLKVGSGRPFWATTRDSLVADLRSILAPQYITRAREIAIRMTKPAESVARATDLLEDAARRRRSG
ncbi:glycosyltransferase [uncultured Mycobacterium sp.]|uniref:glycosyltransferase n=1 Tax=uncultured Mycobacterium sp. TaxID=171292 RepID=UPI0035CA6E25